MNQGIKQYPQFDGYDVWEVGFIVRRGCSDSSVYGNSSAVATNNYCRYCGQEVARVVDGRINEDNKCLK